MDPLADPCDGTCSNNYSFDFFKFFSTNTNVFFLVTICLDFYRYACGKWMDSHVIPEDKAQYGRFEEMAEQLEISIKRKLNDFWSD